MRESRFFLFLKDDDAVAVGAAGVVAHAPAVGSLGEALAVDERVFDFQASSLPREYDLFFQLELAFAHFAHFQRNAASGLEHTRHFLQRGRHLFSPVFELAQLP